MTEFTEDRCPICKAGLAGLEWTRDVIAGNKTMLEMAKEFGVTVEEVQIHIQKHRITDIARQRVRKARQILSDKDFKTAFEFLFTLLMDKIEAIDATGKLDAQTINSISKLTESMRKLLRDVAEIEGKIQSNQVVIQIEQVQKEIDILTDILLHDLCDECQERVLKKLEAVGYNV